MTQQILVAVWFLLSSVFSGCLSSAPPLSNIHKINMSGRQREQMIHREGEKVDKRERQLDQDTGQEVYVVPLSTLYYLKWRDRDEEDGSHLLKRGHSLPSSHPQLPTMRVSGKKVDTKENSDSISATPALITNRATPSAAATETTHITITAATTTPYPVVHTPYPPPSSSTSSSSCSSPGCKWLASQHFIVVVCMIVTWLVALMILYCMTRTAWGKRLLETWSSWCIRDKKDQEEDRVLAKGIGYFDGSPGLRRFVLIEDDDDDDDDEDEDEDEEEEEEDDDDDDIASEFKDVKNKEDKETERGKGREEENRTSKKWKPPRKGTYILQEASKKDVLEVGTYRLQEEEEEEEGEVDGKRKRKEEDKDEEVEYILEGATYILQSERVGRGEIGGRGYGQIGEIEGWYGIVGREGLRGGGYGRIEWPGREYGIMGRGGVGEQGRYGRIGIGGLFGILQGGGVEGGGYRKVVGIGGKGGGRGKRGEDGVLLSVRELEGAVGWEEWEEKVREESTGGGGGRGEGEEWKEIGGGGDVSVEQREGGGGREVKKIVGERKEGAGKEVDKRRGEGGGGGGGIRRDIRNTWGGRKGGEGARAKSERVEVERMWGGSNSPLQKRAASFPMDHFFSSQLMPRKLSLIVEEETH